MKKYHFRNTILYLFAYGEVLLYRNSVSYLQIALKSNSDTRRCYPGMRLVIELIGYGITISVGKWKG